MVEQRTRDQKTRGFGSEFRFCKGREKLPASRVWWGMCRVGVVPGVGCREESDGKHFTYLVVGGALDARVHGRASLVLSGVTI
jgi:hypothetical protein